MHIAIVYVKVKPECVDAFLAATLENARNSVLEPGVARFDVMREEGAPNAFVLYEAYRNAEAPARHKETAHYLKWRDAVAPMMAEPRRGVKYEGLFPDESDG